MSYSPEQRARANPPENEYHGHPSSTTRHPRLYRADQGPPAAEPEQRARTSEVRSGALRRYHHISVGLAVSDALCIVVALVSSYYLRYSGRPVPDGEIAIMLLAPLLWVAVLHTFELYATQHLAAPEEFRRIIGASGVGIVVLALGSYWSNASLSRAWVGLTWAMVLVLELVTRRCWRAWQWRLQLDGRLALRTLVVGTSSEAGRLVEILRLVLASAALVVSFPVWVVIAVAIRLDSRGPVFFHQERVTKDGRSFRMHKFRSMRTDVDAALDTTRPFFKLQSDPRLTRVGAFLRRFSLDELPQFWNVITGEMSIVGPRPLPADQVAANPELLSPRHVVPAGVTGWWQTNGRSGLTPEEALRLDLFYIENWSLTLDMYVVLKTFGAVVGRQGAY